MKIEFYHIDAFEVPNYEPIWRALRQKGIDARMVGVPDGKNTAAKGWFDYDRFQQYCLARGILFTTEADPTADIAVTTQNIDILSDYAGKRVRLMYGLAAYPANWGFQPHAVQPFDAVLTHGKLYHDLFANWLRRDQLPIIGYPRYDDFFAGKLKRDAIRKAWGVNQHKPVLVFLPTWDNNTAFDSFFPALMRLTNQYQIILRPHHCTLRLEPKRMELMRASNLLILDNAFDLASIFAGADIVVTDVRSGALLESALCNVPTIGMVSDIKESSGWLVNQGIDKILTLCNDANQLDTAIQIALATKDKPNEDRKRWLDHCVAFRDGSAAMHAADELIKLAAPTIQKKSAPAKQSASHFEALAIELLNQLEDQKDHPEVWQKIAALKVNKETLNQFRIYLTSLTTIPQEPLTLILIRIVEAICFAYTDHAEFAKLGLLDLIKQYPELQTATGALAHINQTPHHTQKKSINLVGIILGSGKGVRYQSSVPKQYIKINGKPCIKHVVNTFLKSNVFQKIIVVIDDLSYSYLFKEYGDKIEVILGGETRNKSVNNALKHLQTTNPDYVFFHDAARPMLSVSDIFKFVDNINQDCAGLIAVRKIEDSLLETNRNLINRENYRLVQTPEVFDYAVLRNFFDESSQCTAIFEQLPVTLTIKMVNLNHLNYKITSPSDIYMLEHLLKYSPYKPAIPYVQGKTALVLGGTGGIGSEVVKKLREQGVTVVCPTRQELDLAKFSYQFKTNFDIIINAAGAYHTDNEGVLEHYDEIMNVNLKSNLHIIDYVRGLANRPIRVIFISSSSSSNGRENLVVYSASKVALHSVVESMARKLAEEQIYVNVICPEKVRTPLLTKLHGKNFEENELLEPAEVAEAILSYVDTHEFGNIIHLKKGFKTPAKAKESSTT